MPAIVAALFARPSILQGRRYGLLPAECLMIEFRKILAKLDLGNGAFGSVIGSHRSLQRRRGLQLRGTALRRKSGPKRTTGLWRSPGNF